MKNFRKVNLNLIVILVIYVILVLIINPKGNLPINDDWIFYRQVEAFLSGNFRINSLVDPSFISQGMAALLWAKIFGLSFSSLRLLSILFTLVFAIFTYLCLKLLNIRKPLAEVTVLVLLFNPIILNSSMSFMTEIYFLSFTSISLYFLFKYFHNPKRVYLISGGIFSGITLLTRQTGIVLFISYFFIFVINFVRKEKVKHLDIFINFGVLLTTLFIYVGWPKGGLSFISKLVLPSVFVSRLELFLFIPFYFIFFIFPILLSVKDASVNIKQRSLEILFSTPITVFLYLHDIFPIGNVFYVEGLLLKTGFKTNFSLYDNVFFKVVLSFFISFALVKTISLIYRHSKFISKHIRGLDRLHMFLIFCFLGFLFTSVLGNDFYDRYLISAFYFFIILICVFVNRFQELDVKKLYIFVGIFIFFSFSLQYEYFTTTREKWNQAVKLQKITGLKTGIKVSNEYLRLNFTDKTSFINNENSNPAGIEYKCFVQDYTIETSSKLSTFMQKLDNLSSKFTKNPKIYGYKRENLPNIKKNLSRLIYNSEIKSPIYNLVGKKEFVGSWCLK